MNKGLMLVVAALLLLMGSAASASVIHDEATDGDLGGAFPGTLLDVDVGSNVVIGSGDAGVLPIEPFDGFLFVVEPGETLAAIIVESFSGTVGQAVFGSNPATPTLITSFALAPSVGVNALPAPIGSGTYGMTFVGFGPTPTEDYAVNFIVTPLPAALPLFAGSLALLAIVGRRWRRRALARA